MKIVIAGWLNATTHVGKDLICSTELIWCVYLYGSYSYIYEKIIANIILTLTDYYPAICNLYCVYKTTPIYIHKMYKIERRHRTAGATRRGWQTREREEEADRERAGSKKLSIAYRSIQFWHRGRDEADNFSDLFALGRNTGPLPLIHILIYNI